MDQTVLKLLVSSQVRFSALLMLLELAGKLRENYMVLLPETIPFLAELMEGKSLSPAPRPSSPHLKQQHTCEPFIQN